MSNLIRRKTSVCLLMFLLACLLPVGQAWAHARMVRSEPAARAQIKQPPALIRLWFNERIEPAYSSAEVRDESGKVVSSAKAVVSPEDPKQLQMPLPPLVPGTYTVIYRVLSVDGHVVTSRYRFTLRAATR